MKEREFMDMISVSGNKFITVSKDIVDSCPDLVRVINIFRPTDVIIEFNTYGHDEGGLRLKLVYDSFHKLVSSLERYLQKTSDKWNCYSDKNYYPERGLVSDNFIPYIEIQRSIASGKYALPEGWKEKIFLSSILQN
jgi:hypothetical protein